MNLGDAAGLDGSHVVWETNRREMIRAGATEAGFAKRWKEHHSASKLKARTSQQRRVQLMHPDESIAETIECRRGEFQDLSQRVGLGMKRDQIEEILALFEWSKEEELELANLTMRGS